MADKMSKLILPVKSGNVIAPKEFDVGGSDTNTFVGTTAEWEALTEEQQNAYDCRVLTDDDLDTKSVIDNLTSDSATDALSAKQGKVLKGLVDATQGQVSNSGDAYDPTRPYAVGELCIYNNVLYRCTTACSAGSWATNQSCFTADTLTNVTSSTSETIEKTSYKNILSNTPSQTFAQTYTVQLDTNDWNVLNVIVYVDAETSSSRRSVIMTRKDIETSAQTAMAGGYYLRPLAYDSATRTLTLSTDRVGGIIVFTITRIG